MVLLTAPNSSLPAAVAIAREAVAALPTLETARMHVQLLTTSTFGRCVLGLAGFLEFVTEEMRAFGNKSSPTEKDVDEMYQLLMLFADAVCDEDNATFVARIGAHPLLLRLMDHEDDRIQDAAAQIVGNCTSYSTSFTFPHRSRQLGSVERSSPRAVPLPIDSRDNSNDENLSVLIRQVPTRMTGQPKTGYLLWGAAFVLARWVHLHRELFVGKSVLEVGSGLGLGGIVAARYAEQTVLTDYQADTCAALEYNVHLNRPFTHAYTPDKLAVRVEMLDWDVLDKEEILPETSRVDVIIASDIICEPSTAEGFLRVVRHRLKRQSGVAYLMNADSHSRFGVVHLHDMLANAKDLQSKITPVHDLPDGKHLLDTVSDAEELSYEYYEIRVRP